MTARNIPAPDQWANLEASAHRWTGQTPGCTRVETAPYHADNGDAAVLLEIVTPSGYATVALPLVAARLLARAILSAADEARDDMPAEISDYRARFGLDA